MGHVTIRPASEDDVDFLSWAMLQASRSQLDRGLWEYLNATDEPTTLRFLGGLATTDAVHMNHHALFLVAEVDGEPAAAMSGYDSVTQGFSVVGTVVPGVAAASGVRTDDPDFGRRAGVMLSGFVHPVDLPPVAWTIENVATRPEHRRRGLVSALLDAQLDRGREQGYEHASIGVYLGNEPARAAYLKAGFDVVSECRSDGWATQIGCPGTELLLRHL
jgi:ribosomal protein S18 acetylase RimI-like enzyme